MNRQGLYNVICKNFAASQCLSENLSNAYWCHFNILITYNNSENIFVWPCRCSLLRGDESEVSLYQQLSVSLLVATTNSKKHHPLKKTSFLRGISFAKNSYNSCDSFKSDNIQTLQTVVRLSTVILNKLFDEKTFKGGKREKFSIYVFSLI